MKPMLSSWYQADDTPALLRLVRRGSAVKLQSRACGSSFMGTRRGHKCKSHSTDSRFPEIVCNNVICFPLKTIETQINNRWQMNIGGKVNR